VLPQDAEWDELASYFEILPGTRQIILADVDNVQTSCGWGVPFMAFDRERETLKKSACRDGCRCVDGKGSRPHAQHRWHTHPRDRPVFRAC
jgi:hypothetical protein